MQSLQHGVQVQRRSRSRRPGSASAWASRHRRVRVEVRGRAHALPVGHRAAGRARVLQPVEERRACRRCAWSSPVSTTAAFSPRGRYQKRGSGALSRFISVIRFASRRCCSSACGHVDLAHVHPVGLDVAGLGAVEEVVGADRRIGRVPSRFSPAHAGLPWRV